MKFCIPRLLGLNQARSLQIENYLLLAVQWPAWNDFGLSPAPCGSVCTSRTPFRSAVTGKFAGRLSHFTILPSQTVASGQAWWRGCVIRFKVPVGLFLGTDSTGTQSFWNSTLHKHCKPPRLYGIFLKWQVPFWKVDPRLRWPCHM